METSASFEARSAPSSYSTFMPQQCLLVPKHSDHADYFDCPPETSVCFPDAISYKAHFRRRDSWVRNDLVVDNF